MEIKKMYKAINNKTGKVEACGRWDEIKEYLADPVTYTVKSFIKIS